MVDMGKGHAEQQHAGDEVVDRGQQRPGEAISWTWTWAEPAQVYVYGRDGQVLKVAELANGVGEIMGIPELRCNSAAG